MKTPSDKNVTDEVNSRASAVASGSRLPLRWSEYNWPVWVPYEVRKQIESFWSSEYGRSPREWEQSCREAYNYHPPLGTRVKCESDAEYWRDKRASVEHVAGRWVPCWNNMGRVVTDDGQVHVRSVGAILANGAGQPRPAERT